MAAMPPDPAHGYPPAPGPQPGYGYAPGYGIGPAAMTAPAASAPARPGMLTAALAFSIGAAGLTVLAQVVALTSSYTLVEDTLRDELGTNAELVSGLIASAADDAYGTIKVRAWVAIFFALVAVVLALLSRGASLVTRILLSLTLVLSALVTLIAVADIFPTLGQLLGALALLLTPVALVLLFLPPVNRYRRARRAAAAVR